MLPARSKPLQMLVGCTLARAILAEFAENVAKLTPDQARSTAPHPASLMAGEHGERAAPRQDHEQALAPAASELKGGKILWRAFISWLRQVFFGKREAQLATNRVRISWAKPSRPRGSTRFSP